MADQPQDDTENSKGNSRAAPWLDPYRWKPGQTGNAGGRPKSKVLTDALRAALDKPISEEIRRTTNLKPGTTFAELLAETMIREAIIGKNKVSAFSEIADRVEGRAAQSVTLGGDPETPIAVRTLNDFYADNARELTEEQLKKIIAGEDETV
jgi:hypothetical protein